MIYDKPIQLIFNINKLYNVWLDGLFEIRWYWWCDSLRNSRNVFIETIISSRLFSQLVIELWIAIGIEIEETNKSIINSGSKRTKERKSRKWIDNIETRRRRRIDNKIEGTRIWI